MAVPAAGFLIPLALLLLIQALSVSRAERSYESKVCGSERGHPDVGCGKHPEPSGSDLPLPLAPEGEAFGTRLLSGSSDHSATCWSLVVSLRPGCRAMS